MKATVLSSLLTAVFAGASEAKNVVGHSNFQLPSGVVGFDINAHRAADHPNPRVNELYKDTRSLRKRAEDTAEVQLTNQDYSYYSTEIKVGDPGQKITVLLDTGSSDLWLIASDNPYCTKDTKKADNPKSPYVECTDGTFNYKKSKNFHKNDTDFTITYADTTGAEGFWGTDQVKIGGNTVKDLSMGIGTKANTSQGVLGIGLPYAESTNQGKNGFTYENLPQLMKNQGLIKRTAYSLWLNDPKAKHGSLLFGGVDHKKYKGDLVRLPLAQTVPRMDEAVELAVYLSEISIKNGGASDNNKDYQSVYKTNVPALLDSGTTLTFLPQAVIRSIGRGIGAEYMYSLQSYVMPCNPGTATIQFDFNGAKVHVALADMTVPLVDQSGQLAEFDDGTSACALAMSPTNDLIILGDSFLRSAYVVYDLENQEIAMADAQHNVKDSDVEVISSDIPKASKASGYSNTSQQKHATVNAVSLSMDLSSGVGSITSAVMTNPDSPPRPTAAGSAAGSASSSSGDKSGSGNLAAPIAGCIGMSLLMVALV